MNILLNNEIEFERIFKSSKFLIDEIPPYVKILAVVKNRSAEEVNAVINTGINLIGCNYVKEAENLFLTIGNEIEWHMIGHLQKNKVKRAVRLFDMIETVDSIRLAELIDRECEISGKKMPVLIEINSGAETQKAGVLPFEVEELAYRISKLPNLQLQGLMTMGPRFGDPEESRPYFQLTKRLFEELKQAELPKTEMKYLSMGMSNNYKIAIEEGANIIRLGRILFE